MNTSTEQVDDRIEAADRAHRHARDVAPRERATCLRVIASTLAERRNELIERGEHLAATVDHRDPTWGVRVVVHGGDGAALWPTVPATTAEAWRENAGLLQREIFGPAAVVVTYEPGTALAELATLFGGQFTATHAGPDEDISGLVAAPCERAGRLVRSGWPTGVSVTCAQQHGRPYPATTAAGTASVGTAAIGRFMRPVAYDPFPEELPPALRDDNPWGITRRIDGQWQRMNGGDI